MTDCNRSNDANSIDRLIGIETHETILDEVHCLANSASDPLKTLKDASLHAAARLTAFGQRILPDLQIMEDPKHHTSSETTRAINDLGHALDLGNPAALGGAALNAWIAERATQIRPGPVLKR